LNRQDLKGGLKLIHSMRTWVDLRGFLRMKGSHRRRGEQTGLKRSRASFLFQKKQSRSLSINRSWLERPFLGGENIRAQSDRGSVRLGGSLQQEAKKRRFGSTWGGNWRSSPTRLLSHLGRNDSERTRKRQTRIGGREHYRRHQFACPWIRFYLKLRSGEEGGARRPNRKKKTAIAVC